MKRERREDLFVINNLKFTGSAYVVVKRAKDPIKFVDIHCRKLKMRNEIFISSEHEWCRFKYK